MKIKILKKKENKLKYRKKKSIQRNKNNLYLFLQKKHSLKNFYLLKPFILIKSYFDYYVNNLKIYEFLANFYGFSIFMHLKSLFFTYITICK